MNSRFHPSLDWKVIGDQFFNQRLKTAMSMKSGREGDNGKERNQELKQNQGGASKTLSAK